MDKEYWDRFYKEADLTVLPSRFARFVAGRVRKGDRLLDLGCGNGRDSLFFGENGAKVTAVDASGIAIGQLAGAYGDRENLCFVEGDFIGEAEKYVGYYDHIYSRFSIHAIDYEEQTRLLHAVFRALKHGGCLYIEARSIHDEIFGLGEKVGVNEFIYDQHYRRFIVREELEEDLRKAGFFISLSEESRGFAPFESSDPPVIRIAACKEREKRTD